MMDGDFRGRVKVACLKFASSIQNEEPTVAAHNARMRWAQQCFQSPDQMAATIQPPTVMDPNVQSAGANIDDATLQGAVEATANKFI
jgi:hypothetical protein